VPNKKLNLDKIKNGLTKIGNRAIRPFSRLRGNSNPEPQKRIMTKSNNTLQNYEDTNKEPMNNEQHISAEEPTSTISYAEGQQNTTTKNLSSRNSNLRCDSEEYETINDECIGAEESTSTVSNAEAQQSTTTKNPVNHTNYINPNYSCIWLGAKDIDENFMRTIYSLPKKQNTINSSNNNINSNPVLPAREYDKADEAAVYHSRKEAISYNAEIKKEEVGYNANIASMPPKVPSQAPTKPPRSNKQEITASLATLKLADVER